MLLVLVLTSITLITLDSRRDDTGALGVVGRAAHRAVSPVAQAVSAVVDPIGDWFEGVPEGGSLKNEHERLRRELGELEDEQRRASTALRQNAEFRRLLDLPILDLPTETGDITVHCSCTMHMAQPPVDRERRVLYTGLRMPPREDAEVLRDAAREISRVREQSYKTVSQMPSEVG